MLLTHARRRSLAGSPRCVSCAVNAQDLTFVFDRPVRLTDVPRRVRAFTALATPQAPTCVSAEQTDAVTIVCAMSGAMALAAFGGFNQMEPAIRSRVGAPLDWPGEI